MHTSQHELTLEALLSDPLTQLVMQSDNITSADVAKAFATAEAGLRAAAMTPRATGRGLMGSFCGASRMV